MKSKMKVYLRGNETFIPIGSYVEGTEIFRILSKYFPSKGKIAPTSLEELVFFADAAADSIDANTTLIEESQKTISTIMNTNNSLQEKLSMSDDIELTIKKYKSKIEELEYAKCIFVQWFQMIILFNDSCLGFDNDSDHYLYFGIDTVGSKEEILDSDK